MQVNELDPNSPISEQALFWWLLLNEGRATAVDHRAFAEWLTRSPERVAAYLEAVRLAAALRSFRPRHPDISLEETFRAASNTRGEIVVLPNTLPNSRSTRTQSRRRHLWLWPGLAAITLLATLGIGLIAKSRPLALETAVGEQRSVVLTDGSLVTLNTASSVEVVLSKDHRMVKLLAGEALFKIAHDASRPFDVSVGNTVVRAVGTQFDVKRSSVATTVTVVEGRVAVLETSGKAQEPLNAGEQVVIESRAKRTSVRTDVAAAIAWTQRKLVFERRPLGEVAAEFNRYNHRTIEIVSPELRTQEVTGVFQADDPESFLTFLSGLPDVTIQEAPDHTRFLVTEVH